MEIDLHIKINKKYLFVRHWKRISAFSTFLFFLVFLLHNQYPVSIGATSNKAKAATTKFGNITQCPPSGPCVLGANTSVAAPYQDIGGNAYDSGTLGVQVGRPLGPLGVGDASVGGSDGYIVFGKNDSKGGTRQTRGGYDSNFNFAIGDYGNSNVAGTWIEQLGIAWNAPANDIYINSSGNVGIGNNTPKSRLDVSGDTSSAR